MVGWFVRQNISLSEVTQIRRIYHPLIAYRFLNLIEKSRLTFASEKPSAAF